MSSIVDITAYTPDGNDKFFFDANIWMYLFCPIGGYRKDVVIKYDGFLKKAIQMESPIFISSLVLSEFFNAYTRLEFNILRNKDCAYKNYKKDFRGTEKYKQTVTEIKTIIETKILKLSKRINDKFDDIDLTKVLANVEESDFNDNYYKVLLSEFGENIKIVTDDYDFSRVADPVSIVTANPNLLRRTQKY